jgi:hypothetical protein
MKNRPPKDFGISVFINCPFDEDYKSLLRPMLFTLVDAGLVPRLASEKSDSLEHRLEKIVRLIQECKYSVHDLSRFKAAKAKELFRMNMPFELGIDYGCRRTATNYLSSKRSLILETRRYDVQKALSDLNGIDIKNHNNNPSRVVQALQHWFIETVGLTDVDSPAVIWKNFTEFRYDFFERRKAQGYSKDDLKMMPVPQYIRFITQWLDPKRRRLSQ